MLRTLRAVLATAAVLAFSAAQAAPERAVSIGLQAAITSIDPHYHNLSPNNSMLLHIFEPLIMRDPNQKLVPGMTLAIEPMVNAGGPGVKILKDGWTAVTQDGSLSAHFEHTVLITGAEPEILTCLEKAPLRLKAQ